MLPTPNFQISKDYEVRLFSGEFKIIKAWSFVRPIEYGNLPSHIKNAYEAIENLLIDNSFCYTIYGIVLIPDKFIERV